MTEQMDSRDRHQGIGEILCVVGIVAVVPGYQVQDLWPYLCSNSSILEFDIRRDVVAFPAVKGITSRLQEFE